MKHTLLLRLKAPMQSWGIGSRFSIRETGKEPTKSGVIGLLCAALGISRDEANTNNPRFIELTKLKMNVRVLAEGILQKDYHTAQNIAKAAGGTKPTELSDRWFLADADFLIGLEGDDPTLLESLHQSVQKPKWQLFLGRKAFVPSVPVYFPEKGLQSGDAETILREFEIESQLNDQRMILEDDNGTEIRQDVPLDFAKRHFSLRRVRTEFLTPIQIEGEKEDGNLSDKNDFESAF